MEPDSRTDAIWRGRGGGGKTHFSRTRCDHAIIAKQRSSSSSGSSSAGKAIATLSKMALLRSYELLDSEDSGDAESEDLDRLLRYRCMPVFRLPLPPWASSAYI